jgi:hypothetical protein
VHSIVTSREGTDGEFKLRGHARLEEGPEQQSRYAAAMRAKAGWEPEPGRFHLFAVGVDDVSFIRWDTSTNDQFVTRWPAGDEFVRRGTSGTSLGAREPHPSPLLDDRPTG